MVKIEKFRESQPVLDQFIPQPNRSPEGKYTDHARNYFFSHSYLKAKKLSRYLNRLGFDFERAGITVDVNPKDVAIATALLSKILDPDMGTGMKTRLPSYFMSLTSPHGEFPSYLARNITSALDEPNGRASIVKEHGYKRTITFESKPKPCCLFGSGIRTDEKFEPLFIDELKRRTGSADIDNQHIIILAGIGKNSQEIVDSVIMGNKQKFRNVEHGSTVISLARIAMALVDWGGKNPNKSLFYISTARLINDQRSVPQAYLLNRIFGELLGWNPSWLGLCSARVGATREVPTGAVLVEIKPEQYQEALEKIKTQFNLAVEKMISAPENAGLF